MFRTSGQSTSTQTKWQLQSPLSMLRKTCILYVSSDPSTWFQTLGRKCKLQIFVFFMKSCSTWEIILIDSKQLKVKKAQRSSVNPLFSHRWLWSVFTSFVTHTLFYLLSFHFICWLQYVNNVYLGFNTWKFEDKFQTPSTLILLFCRYTGGGLFMKMIWLPGWDLTSRLICTIPSPWTHCSTKLLLVSNCRIIARTDLE